MHTLKASVLLNSPIILGASVLDLSKVIMYDLYYNKLSAVGFTDLTLLYTDTDSFLISVKNSFSEIETIILENNQIFDLSNLSPSSNLYRNSSLIECNRRKVGLLRRSAGVCSLERLPPKKEERNTFNTGCGTYLSPPWVVFWSGIAKIWI